MYVIEQATSVRDRKRQRQGQRQKWRQRKRQKLKHRQRPRQHNYSHLCANGLVAISAEQVLLPGEEAKVLSTQNAWKKLVKEENWEGQYAWKKVKTIKQLKNTKCLEKR